METAADITAAVHEGLDLLTAVSVVTAVTLYHQSLDGSVHITVRKTAQRSGQRTHYHYTWEVRTMTEGRAREWTGAEAYTTAEAAYQAGVEAASRQSTATPTLPRNRAVVA